HYLQRREDTPNGQGADRFGIPVKVVRYAQETGAQKEQRGEIDDADYGVAVDQPHKDHQIAHDDGGKDLEEGLHPHVYDTPAPEISDDEIRLRGGNKSGGQQNQNRDDGVQQPVGQRPGMFSLPDRLDAPVHNVGPQAEDDEEHVLVKPTELDKFPTLMPQPARHRAKQAFRSQEDADKGTRHHEEEYPEEDIDQPPLSGWFFTG